MCDISHCSAQPTLVRWLLIWHGSIVRPLPNLPASKLMRHPVTKSKVVQRNFSTVWLSTRFPQAITLDSDQGLVLNPAENGLALGWFTTGRQLTSIV